MDLHGTELSATKGAKETLPKVQVFHAEISFRAMYEGQPLFYGVHPTPSRNFSLRHMDASSGPTALAALLDYRVLRTGPWVANAVYLRRSSPDARPLPTP